MDCKSSLAWDKSIPSVSLPFRRAQTLFPRENVSSVRGTAVTSDKTVSWWRDNSKGLGTQTGRQFGLFQRIGMHGILRGLWVAFLCGLSVQNHTHRETLTHTNTEQSIHQPPSSPPQIIRHVKSTKNFFFFFAFKKKSVSSCRNLFSQAYIEYSTELMRQRRRCVSASFQPNKGSGREQTALFHTCCLRAPRWFVGLIYWRKAVALHASQTLWSW